MILEGLTRIVPVHAVRGNTDRGAWAADLVRNRVVEVGGHLFYVLHELYTLDLNPGSAGPRRFKLPVSLAKVFIQKDSIDYKIIYLIK
jgi:hypothetical protein